MAGELPFGWAPSGELTAYTPTLRERVSDWLRPMLFSDDRAGQEKANRLTNWAETMIPPFGFATQMYDTGRAGGEGDYLTAGTIGAMAMIPGYHGSPVKGLTRLERKGGRNPVFLAVDDGTPRPRQYASGYAGDDGQVYKAKFDDANVLDARTPEGRTALISALDNTYPLGGEAYLWEKGVSEGQLPGWGDDMLFRSLENAGFKGALINERPDVVSAAIFDPSIIEMQRQGIRAYHGSPHSFDKFSMDKIGTGEGAQAYGHGLYQAEKSDIGRGYRDSIMAAQGIDPEMKIGKTPINDFYTGMEQRLARMPSKQAEEGYNQLALLEDLAYGGDVLYIREKAAQGAYSPQTMDWFEKTIAPQFSRKGTLYEVNIDADPNAFLDWDKPLSEQPEAVQKAYNKTLKGSLVTRVIGDNENFGPLTDVSVPGGGSLGVFTKDQLPDVLENPSKYAPLTGGGLYSSLVENHHLNVNPPTPFLQSKATATEKLKKAGILGIKYLDAGSRGAGDGTRNFVVFDENLISIVRKYGIAGASAMLGYNLLESVNPAQADELKRIEAGK